MTDNFLIIGLQNNETTIKENILDSYSIAWIKADSRNYYIIIASHGFEKVCLVDFRGNKLTNHQVNPFLLSYFYEGKFYLLNQDFVKIYKNDYLNDELGLEKF